MDDTLHKLMQTLGDETLSDEERLRATGEFIKIVTIDNFKQLNTHYQMIWVTEKLGQMIDNFGKTNSVATQELLAVSFAYSVLLNSLEMIGVAHVKDELIGNSPTTKTIN